ncbi:hypothetical protein D9756_010814 [Leucocoprinus leucothites]|uniref:Nephrocystin 3-like N-terminal domain-containing protein n=1 Tax=Leucocoprinus leucothites TaxID=201217 RepID=A0A8H5FRJ9_9AGAR|nr:hypothetical protein D9756_010814 [Leucoagaricus leucothites]
MPGHFLLKCTLSIMTFGTFANAHDFSIHEPHFSDNSTHVNVSLHLAHNISEMSGLQVLLESSLPEAFHDSSARHPPPRCHPGTREHYIEHITSWAWNKGGQRTRVLLMTGAAGVGKSAIAQSCTEAVGEKLGAAFFFSRSNGHNDPKYLFTSIAYQLATRNLTYATILDDQLRRDPTIVTKSIGQQFHQLIVAPLKEMTYQGHGMDDLLVVVDGLDECSNSQRQREIAEIITTSAYDQTTPLLWAFFSRPGPQIVAAFNSPHAVSSSTRIELPVSRDSDPEIFNYLRGELKKISEEHTLPVSWPSEGELQTLVDLAAGLFIYAVTVVRFVGAYDSISPPDNIRAIIALNNSNAPTDDSLESPLSELDIFYSHIMESIPTKVLPSIQRILLATTAFVGGKKAPQNASLLGLSEAQFRGAYRWLYAVLMPLDSDLCIRFYHSSFMEFLQDRARSGRFCLKAQPAIELRKSLIGKLRNIQCNFAAGAFRFLQRYKRAKY